MMSSRCSDFQATRDQAAETILEDAGMSGSKLERSAFPETFAIIQSELEQTNDVAWAVSTLVPGYLLDTLAPYCCVTYRASYLYNQPRSRYCSECQLEYVPLPLGSILHLALCPRG